MAAPWWRCSLAAPPRAACLNPPGGLGPASKVFSRLCGTSPGIRVRADCIHAARWTRLAISSLLCWFADVCKLHAGCNVDFHKTGTARASGAVEVRIELNCPTVSGLRCLRPCAHALACRRRASTHRPEPRLLREISKFKFAAESAPGQNAPSAVPYFVEAAPARNCRRATDGLVPEWCVSSGALAWLWCGKLYELDERRECVNALVSAAS